MKIIKQMLLLPIVLLVITLNSCKKEASVAPVKAVSTMSATVNGVNTLFNTSVTTLKGGQTYTALQGVSVAGDRMSVVLFGNAQTIAGKYIATQAAPGVVILGFQLASSGNISYSDLTKEAVIVMVTGVSDQSVQGTFQGSVTLYGGEVKKITNGQFNITF